VAFAPLLIRRVAFAPLPNVGRVAFAPQSALGEIPSDSCNQTKALLILMLKRGFLPH